MNNKKGFTLVELICVIGVLIILIGIFSFNMISSLKKNTEEQKSNVIAQIKSAADAYVAANPETVKKLYEGYGYVDIPVGDLRNDGTLSEEIKNPETGEIVPDDEVVRVILNGGDYMEFIYPVDDEQEAWMLHAEPLTVQYDESITQEDWCNEQADRANKKRVFNGLITDTELSSSSYADITSKLYLLNNEEENSDLKGRMYNGDYFSEEINLRLDSCNVNPRREGLYNVTYLYKDPKLGTEKKQNRTVYVAANTQDIISFEVKTINDDKEIMQLTPEGNIIIVILEHLRGGGTRYVGSSSGIKISELPNYGYNITNFQTSDLALDGRDALISSSRINSDGSTPEAQYKKYIVVPAEFDVYFDARGGSVNPTKITVKYKEKYNKKVNGEGTNGFPDSASRTGYTFQGWYTSPTEGTRITGDTQVTDVNVRTLYAHWKPNPYTISYNSDGGTPPTYPSNTIDFEDYYKLPSEIPTKNGYDFQGWYTGRNGSGSRITTSSRVNIADNHTLYAYWRGKPYDVTFDPNGGNGSRTTITQYFGSYYSLPTSNPYKTGYTFNGWYTSSSGGSKKTSSTIMNTAADHTLYAQYSEKTYRLTYDANGGSVYPSTKTIKYSDGKMGTLPPPSRTGYKFLGWYTSRSGGSPVSSSTPIHSDTTIYAHWEIIYYRVTFDANGGSPTPASKNVTYGGSYGSISTPTKSGYIFQGWYTRNSCSGSRVYSNGTVNTASDHTLYACWQQESVQITFMANGGKINGGSSKTVSVPKESDPWNYAPTPTPPCAYKFANWRTSSSGGSIMPESVSSNATYYAIYTGNDTCTDYTGCGTDLDRQWITRMSYNSRAWRDTNTNAADLPIEDIKRIKDSLHNCNIVIAQNKCGGGTGGETSSAPWYSNDICPGTGGRYTCFANSVWYTTPKKVSTIADCKAGQKLYTSR